MKHIAIIFVGLFAVEHCNGVGADHLVERNLHSLAQLDPFLVHHLLDEVDKDFRIRV